ncbi:MAG: hypothetical protein HY918_04675 [Candidatus Doudnabacteria bacterium]|nr:hypothetical protein [Candidatus Doudnabacteria bacterium]
MDMYDRLKGWGADPETAFELEQRGKITSILMTIPEIKTKYPLRVLQKIAIDLLDEDDQKIQDALGVLSGDRENDPESQKIIMDWVKSHIINTKPIRSELPPAE